MYQYLIKTLIIFRTRVGPEMHLWKDLDELFPKSEKVRHFLLFVRALASEKIDLEFRSRRGGGVC